MATCKVPCESKKTEQCGILIPRRPGSAGRSVSLSVGHWVTSARSMHWPSSRQSWRLTALSLSGDNMADLDAPCGAAGLNVSECSACCIHHPTLPLSHLSLQSVQQQRRMDEQTKGVVQQHSCSQTNVGENNTPPQTFVSWVHSEETDG